MKNSYEVRSEVTAIFIESPKYGKFETIIDTSDLDKARSFLNSWRVRFYKETNSYYVLGNLTVDGSVKTFSLHRWLMNNPTGYEVDHINTDSLDNRRSCNLRTVTKGQNAQNRRGAQRNNKSSGIRGVTWSKFARKWMVQVYVNGKRYNGGLFESLSDAEKRAIQLRKTYMPFSRDYLNRRAIK